MTEKHKDFPSPLQATLLVLALFCVEVIVWAAVHDAQGVLALTRAQSDAIVAVLANGCLFAFLLEFKGLTYRETFHPSGEVVGRTVAARVVPVLMLVPAVVLAMSVVSSVVERAFPMSPSDEALFARMGAEGMAITLIVCVIAPVVEEMFFRGIVLRSFLHRYDRARSIWGSALLFGAAHLNVYQFFVALLVGGLSGWLYERGRSLLPCIALHVAFNTAVTTLGRSSADATMSLHESASAGVWIGCLALAAAGVLALSFAGRGPSTVRLEGE